MPAMSKEDDRARDEFTSEAEELLDTLSRDLVEFESQGRDVRPEVINKIFREVHSLKGLAGMLGFGEISELAAQPRGHARPVAHGQDRDPKDLIDLLYDAVDSLNRLVISVHDPSVGGLIDVAGLTRRIHQLVTNQPAHVHGNPFEELTLDEQTRKSLTEYEEHRLQETSGPGADPGRGGALRFQQLRREVARADRVAERVRGSDLHAAGHRQQRRLGHRLPALVRIDPRRRCRERARPEGKVTSLRKTEAAPVAAEVEAEKNSRCRSISQTVSRGHRQA